MAVRSAPRVRGLYDTCELWFGQEGQAVSAGTYVPTLVLRFSKWNIVGSFLGVDIIYTTTRLPGFPCFFIGGVGFTHSV